MLLQHVVPLFASPYGHLRAKACWLAGIFADIEFSDGQGGWAGGRVESGQGRVAGEGVVLAGGL